MGSQTAYHHGDLRRALLDAARELLSRQGAAGLTLRGIARAANVSHSAPYHHFKDKDALLAAVAEEGFRALEISIETRTGASANPALVLQEAAVAYVVFAVTHPALFRVMFGPHLADKTDFPTLQEASRSAYRYIERGMHIDAAASEASKTRARQVASASWSLIHGLAMLLIDKQFGSVAPGEAEDMARSITDVFWVGLSNVAGSR